MKTVLPLKQPPVPLVRRSAPPGWAIAVDQSVVEYVGTFVSVVVVELRIRAAEPNVIATRRHATDHAGHCAEDVCRVSDPFETGLRTRDGETRERCAFKPNANLGCPVLERIFK